MSIVTTKCKHGIELTNTPCPVCKSLWNKDTADENYELEYFFRKGIETLAGQKGRIHELEKKLHQTCHQTPRVTCHGCHKQMSTQTSRTRVNPNAEVEGTSNEVEEVLYLCPTCGHQVWVAKLKEYCHESCE